MNKIIGFILLLWAGSALAAPDPAGSIPAAFMEQLVRGINGRDLAALRSITHPATQKCMTPDTEAYYRWWLWKDGSKRYAIPMHYKAELSPPIDAKAFEPEAGDQEKALLHWPLQPDSGLHILYSPAPKTTLQRVFEITLKNGEARLVMDCPTPAGLADFRKMAHKDAARKERLARLWKTMDPADLEAFQTMASQGMKFEVMKGAEQKYHLDPDTSLAFMDMVTYGDTP
jgi:hypothetical protein